MHARARAQMSCVTMKIKTCHSEDLHSLTNYHMYLEGTLTIEYNLPENDRKMTFLKNNLILLIFGARKRARTGMMM